MLSYWWWTPDTACILTMQQGLWTVQCLSRAGSSIIMRPVFDFSFRRYYCLLVYIVCFTTSFFLHFLLTYLLPYWFFSFENIYPLRFQTGWRKRRLNLAVVLHLFCVVVRFFWLVNACFCCVRFSFFRTKPRDRLGETSPKWPILFRVGRKTTTQPINQ